MKKYVFNNQELNILKLEKIEKDLVFRKVTREFFTHDEDLHHINSVAAINIDYVDFDNEKHSKEIVLHKEYIRESFGWELDYDVYDYIECVKETDEFKEARRKIEDFYNQIINDFQFEENN